MNHALGDPLTIEPSELLDEVKVFQKHRGPSGPAVFEFSLSPTGAPESCVIGAGAASAVVDNSPITQKYWETRAL